MKWIRYFFSHFKAAGSFLHTLFRRKDLLVSGEGEVSSSFPLLKGWEYSPEAKLIRNLSGTGNPARMHLALYCYEGAHRGETFSVSKNLETLGSSTQNTIVITPRSQHQSQSYQIVLSPKARIISEPGHSFNLNGVEQCDAEIYDYDELEVFGNKFLVFEVGGLA